MPDPSNDMPEVIEHRQSAEEMQSIDRAGVAPAFSGNDCFARSELTTAGLEPAACGCSTGNGGRLVYALGQIGYDFGTDSRRDSLRQNLQIEPGNPDKLLEHLDSHPWDAASVIWTLNVDSTPIYSILPSGPYATVAYERLREFLRSQATEGVEMVAIPGLTGGTVPLQSGARVPALLPEIRGMCSWSTAKLVKAACTTAGEPDRAERTHEAVRGFLEKIYYELRNPGVAPQERAVNYAATNAFQSVEIFDAALKQNMELDRIGVERSPICPPGSDCWDVRLTFFNPMKRLEQSRRVYRFTIDVSDVVPVAVGKTRSWSVY